MVRIPLVFEKQETLGDLRHVSGDLLQTSLAKTKKPTMHCACKYRTGGRNRLRTIPMGRTRAAIMGISKAADVESDRSSRFELSIIIVVITVTIRCAAMPSRFPFAVADPNLESGHRSRQRH
jgi:hypothetical protein